MEREKKEREKKERERRLKEQEREKKQEEKKMKNKGKEKEKDYEDLLEEVKQLRRTVAAVEKMAKKQKKGRPPQLLQDLQKVLSTAVFIFIYSFIHFCDYFVISLSV
jgi:colicin import membrane protein